MVLWGYGALTVWSLLVLYYFGLTNRTLVNVILKYVVTGVILLWSLWRCGALRLTVWCCDLNISIFLLAVFHEQYHPVSVQHDLATELRSRRQLVE